MKLGKWYGSHFMRDYYWFWLTHPILSWRARRDLRHDLEYIEATKALGCGCGYPDCPEDNPQ